MAILISCNKQTPPALVVHAGAWAFLFTGFGGFFACIRRGGLRSRVLVWWSRRSTEPSPWTVGGSDVRPPSVVLNRNRHDVAVAMLDQQKKGPSGSARTGPAERQA